MTVAARVYNQTHGVRLLRPHLRVLDAAERKGMRTTMFHTLVIQYSRVVQTQLPAVLLGALAGTTQAGIYKIGTAATAIIGKIIQPASQALLPRISRLWACGPHLRAAQAHLPRLGDLDRRHGDGVHPDRRLPRPASCTCSAAGPRARRPAPA